MGQLSRLSRRFGAYFEKPNYGTFAPRPYIRPLSYRDPNFKFESVPLLFTVITLELSVGCDFCSQNSLSFVFVLQNKRFLITCFFVSSRFVAFFHLVAFFRLRLINSNSVIRNSNLDFYLSFSSILGPRFASKTKPKHELISIIITTQEEDFFVQRWFIIDSKNDRTPKMRENYVARLLYTYCGVQVLVVLRWYSTQIGCAFVSFLIVTS